MNEILNLLRLVEFTRSDDVPVLIRPIWVVGCVAASRVSHDPLVCISTLGTEDLVEVKGTLREIQDRLDGDRL